jgi:hypothetical protein
MVAKTDLAEKIAAIVQRRPPLPDNADRILEAAIRMPHDTAATAAPA